MIPEATIDEWLEDEPDAAPQAAPDACPVAVSIMDLVRPSHNDPNELIRHRFLCRGGGLLLVGPTGVGKSSLSMQIMIGLALGRNVLGIDPARPLKSLLIQAENDDGDLAEFRDGVTAGMDLTEEEKAIVRERVTVCTEDARAGLEFCTTVVEPLLERHRPDLVWIDPALAYVGGDSNSGKDVGQFLRQGLNPLIHRYGCAVVIIHHTAKPLRATGSTTAPQDFAYAGSGSAEWANWSRATLALDPTADGAFRLIARKRGSRLRWKDEAGESTSLRFICHCRDEGRVWWEETTEDAPPQAARVILKPQKKVSDLMALVPDSGHISKDKLEDAAREAGINEKRFRSLSSQAVESGVLFPWKIARKNARPAVHFARLPQPEEGKPDQPEEGKPEEIEPEKAA